jgi:hypothetical protein
MGNFRHVWQTRKPSSFVEQSAIIQPSNAVGTTFQFYDVANFGSDLNLKYPNMVMQPGDVFWQQDNAGYGISSAFQYVNAKATLAFAQVVTMETIAVDTVIAAGSSSQVIQITTGTTFVENGNLVYVENGGVNPQLRVIKANVQGASGTLTVSMRDQNNTFNAPDADALPYTPTNGSNVQIIRPNNRIVCTASTMPFGVALGAVTFTTPTTFTEVLVSGICLVSAAGTLPLVVGKPGIPGASGTITGQAAAYAAGTNAIAGGASFMPLFAFAAAGPESIPFAVNCLGAI